MDVSSYVIEVHLTSKSLGQATYHIKFSLLVNKSLETIIEKFIFGLSLTSDTKC